MLPRLIAYSLSAAFLLLFASCDSRTGPVPQAAAPSTSTSVPTSATELATNAPAKDEFRPRSLPQSESAVAAPSEATSLSFSEVPIEEMPPELVSPEDPIDPLAGQGTSVPPATAGAETEPSETTPAEPEALAFDGKLEDFLAELAGGAEAKYDGRRVRVTGIVDDFGVNSLLSDRSYPVTHLECEPESKTPAAEAARNFSSIGLSCYLTAPPWTKVKVGDSATLVGKFQAGGTALRDAELEGGGVVEYPRVTAMALGEELARDLEGTTKKYDGKYYIVEGEVASEDRYEFVLVSVEGHPVTCTHGLMAGPAFDSLQKGDRVEVLGKLWIFEGKVRFDQAVNFGYSY